MNLTAELANLYESSPAATPTSAELAQFRLWIGREVRQIPAAVRFTPAEVDLATTCRCYLEHGVLPVSTAHNSHPWLTPTQNAWFRAIHDWHHVLACADTSLAGEVATYLVARSSAPHEVWWILFSEIVLQAATCIHNGGRFPQQKLVRS